MSVVELLSALRENGIELRVEGERLRCIAERGKLTPELAEQIRVHKAELLKLLDGVGSSAAPAGSAAIPRAAEQARYGLSVTQNRASVSAREGAVLPTAFRVRGPLDVDALRATLARIVARHAPLRTRFYVDRDPPEQEVEAELGVEVGLTDLEQTPESEREAKLASVLDAERAFRFDVTRLPLFRFQLVRLSALDHVLFAAFSPLSFDGWSFDVFWNEMRLGYAALSRGEPWPLPDLPISYGDFVAWQRARLEQRDAALSAFWRERLGEQLPPLPLPTDRPRPRLTSNRGGNIGFELPTAMSESIRAFSRTHGVTPQMVMLAALYAWLNRLGGEEKIIIGAPVEARIHPSMEVLIGPFVNMLLLPMRVNASETFAAFAQRVRDESLTAYDYQEYPIERLQVRSRPTPGGGIAPAFQVEFSFQQVSQRGSHMGQLSLSQLELASGAATNDLTLWVKDWGDRIAGAIEYKSDLYDRETVTHWFGSYTHFLRSALERPELRLADVDVLGPELETVRKASLRASSEPPVWLSSELRAFAGGAESPLLRVVDEQGRPRPLGVYGNLELVSGGRTERTNIRLRLMHDGRLLRQESTAEDGTGRRRGPREAPRTDLEVQLTALFAELLNVPDAGATDDYFELGGNSLLAVRLFAEIQRRFGTRLPLATLLEAGTPRALAQVVINQYPVRDSCLIKLKSGTTNQCLFLLHDADGETLLYMNLARRMPPWLTVYGVEPLRAGSVPMVHTTLEEAAAHYVKEIRRVQPEGPYRVGGLCAGGVFSYEIARQLTLAGERVDLVAFIDAAPPHARKRMSLNARRWERFSALKEQVGANGVAEVAQEALRKISNVARFELKNAGERASARSRILLLRHVYRNGEGWPSRLPAPTPREVFGNMETEFAPKAVSKVSPVLFCATVGAGENQPFCELLIDPLFDWQSLFEDPVRRVDASGGHSSMLQEPYVEELARQLIELIERGASRASSRHEVRAASSA